MKPLRPETATQNSPQEYGEECGGKGGVPYLCIPQTATHLSRITIWHRDYVDGLQLETPQGALPRIGGTGQHRDVQENSFSLEPEEYLTGITVEYWQYIDRITFHTNKRNHGPFGGTGGLLRKTLLAPPERRIVGFKGRHWQLVDSIQLMIA